MKLLYLNHNVAGTGTYHRAFNLARVMCARGCDVTLVTTSRARRLSAHECERDGVRVIETPDLLSGPARTGWDSWNAAWRVRRLARERFDLIHAFDCRPAVILPALSQRRRDCAPLFIDWADWWGRGGTIVERSGWAVRTMFGPVETWFEEHFRTGATANTTISETLRERCIALGVPAERVLALPNGCEPAFVIDRAAARRTLGLGDEPLVAHLGVMQRADAEFLFDAFRRVREAIKDVKLILVGNFSGAVPADIAAATARTGFVDNDSMRVWLAAADIGALPLRDTLSSRGRWPGKLSEYLTAGLPMVVPHVGAAAALVQMHGAAVTCNADPTSFAAAMITALRDVERRGRISAAARALADGELAWARIGERLSAFYTTGAADQRLALGA